ncbi:MAG TPA: YciI family protein [Solirubrobacterales bacterium]|nr:YciI family protein [Solirubrobacterales bacterium]
MKFMLLQSYGGVPEGVPPMSEWTPEEIEAHIDFQKDLNAELRERGELVEAQALTAPQLAKFVVSDGSGAPLVTDGPFPESKELLAGYRMIDVDSPERAIEIAARGSAAPGPGGRPIKQTIEVREVMGAIEH